MIGVALTVVSVGTEGGEGWMDTVVAGLVVVGITTVDGTAVVGAVLREGEVLVTVLDTGAKSCIVG